MRKIFLLTFLIAVAYSCQFNVDSGKSVKIGMEVVSDTVRHRLKVPAHDVFYDKILGSLVGSAIGDAMGAPTEMWSRDQRQRSYGKIDALDPSFIEPSPEGLWDYYLPPGSTTDDTRWKSLIGNYLISNAASFYQSDGPNAAQFARHILSAYRDEVKQLKNISARDPIAIDYKVRRLTWLQEWAMVAEPFTRNDLEGYTTALHRFYGGDLLCAGMLYAPVLGLPYPGDPYQAYKAAFRLGLFDQGYARDITALTASMVAAALNEKATPDSILSVFRTIDPNQYFRSRLFSRESFRTLQTAQFIASEAKKLSTCADESPAIQLKADSLASCQTIAAFSMLDQQNQHSPAHAQEILLVTLTSMIFSDFDFRNSIEFIANYGRDNDTSGAVAGAILGAYLGYQKLPEDLKSTTIATNRKNLGIDLVQLASEITDEIEMNLSGAENL